MHKLDPVLGIAALGQQVALNETCPLPWVRLYCIFEIPAPVCAENLVRLI